MQNLTPAITNLKGVIALTSLSRSTIYELEKAGKFPRHMKIAGTTRSVWRVADVQQWIDENLEVA